MFFFSLFNLAHTVYPEHDGLLALILQCISNNDMPYAQAFYITTV